MRQATSETSTPPTQSVEVDDARLQARNDLIDELQTKITELGDKHRQAAGELHTTQLDLESVQEEAQSWQTKWHEVTASLDISVVEATRNGSALQQAKKTWEADQVELEESHQEILNKAQRDSESLRVRNGNLAETIDFANKQIESLSEDISLLVAQSNQADEALAGVQQDNEQLQKNHAETQQRVLTLEGQLADGQGNLDDANATLKSITEDSKAQSGRVLELEQELSTEDQRYRDAMQAAEAEQSALTKQLDRKDEVSAEIKAELAEQKSINTELSARCEQLQQSLTQLNDKLDENLQQAQTQDAEVQMLKHANTQLEQTLVAAQQASESSAEKVETAQAELTVSIEQCNRLQEQLHEAQAEKTETQALTAAQAQRDAESIAELSGRCEQSAATEQQAIEHSAEKVEAAQIELAASVERCNLLQGQLHEAQAKQSDTQTLAITQSEQDAESIAALQAELAIAVAQKHELQEQNTTQTEELNKLTHEHDRWAENEHDLLDQVNAIAEAGQQKQLELDAEIERLNNCVEQAQDSNSQRETERSELAAKVQVLSVDNAKLNTHLEERSALVRELEAERSRYAESLSAKDIEQEKTNRQLSEMQHRVTTFQDHAQTLEGKMVTQQGLMSELEVELSDAQSDQVSAVKAVENQSREAKQINAKVAEQLAELQHQYDDLQSLNIDLQKRLDAPDSRTEELAAEVERERAARLEQQNGVHALQAELDSQQSAHRKELAELEAQLNERAAQINSVSETLPNPPEQLRELQQLLRERTEELDKMRWRQEQQPAATDDNIVMILNQQLSDAREESARLRAKLKASAEAEHTSQPDDLTELKGIGEKLVEQLNALGITAFEQIAQLDTKSLESDDHPLQGFKARIIRDEWVEQAKAKLKTR